MHPVVSDLGVPTVLPVGVGRPDNRIHGSASSNGGQITRPDAPDQKPVSVSGRDFSFDPRTLELRAESGGAQHGMTFDDWGRKLVCSNSDHIQLVMFEDRYLTLAAWQPGDIVNIASNAGLMGQAYTVPYCATKGAVVNMTKALAMEFIKQTIRINAIAPGGVDTPLTHNFRIPPDVDFALMGRYTPLRPMAKPDDIANLFLFLCSDEGRNIHGSILSSDGGVTAG